MKHPDPPALNNSQVPLGTASCQLLSSTAVPVGLPLRSTPARPGRWSIGCRNLFNLLAEFVRSGAPSVDLDLGGVGFFDASGIAFLVLIRNLCIQGGGASRITAPSEPVRYVLALVRMGEVFSSS